MLICCKDVLNMNVCRCLHLEFQSQKQNIIAIFMLKALKVLVISIAILI